MGFEHKIFGSETSVSIGSSHSEFNNFTAIKIHHDTVSKIKRNLLKIVHEEPRLLPFLSQSRCNEIGRLEKVILNPKLPINPLERPGEERVLR